jgi:hypothetical protein
MKLISIFIFLLITLTQATAQKRADVVLFDFEQGTLDKWNLEGSNPFYGKAPVNTDNEYKQWSRSPVGYKGKFYLESGANEGRHTNNPDGRIISPEFKITRHFLNFYIGGEVHPKVRVYLVVNGEEVREAFGNNFYDLILRGWDVKAFKNQSARIVIEDMSDMRSLIRVDHIFLSDTPPPAQDTWVNIPERQRSNIVSPGEFKLIFSNEALGEGWKITNSTIVFGNDNKWHLFASAYQGNKSWNDKTWKNIIHATADDLQGNWNYEGIVMSASEEYGEDFLWYPYVIMHENKYYMFYVGAGYTWSGWYTPPSGKQSWHAGNSGSQGPYFMYCAVSDDGKTWERKGEAFKGKKGVIFVDRPFAFAPFVMRHNDEWVMYYSSTTEESVYAKHAVGYRTSKDLINWGERKIALKDWDLNDEFRLEKGHPGSPWPEHTFFNYPVVVNKNNKWYLMTGPIDNNNLSRYHALRIYSSDSPFLWNNHKEAFEVNKRLFVDGGGKPFQDGIGNWFITTTNDMSGGVWLAPLFWNEDQIAEK